MEDAMVGHSDTNARAQTSVTFATLIGELVGTGLLIVAVVGSGIMAQSLSSDNGVQLLANTGATVGALYVLILMLGPISGAHFNPLVSLVATLRGTLPWRQLPSYLIVQVIGACLGTAVANLMFDSGVWSWSNKVRDGAGIWLGEVVATAGLITVIVLVSQSRPDAVAGAVAAWIGGAYWFTSSTSLANPAITVARSLSDSFAGIAPESVPMFVIMQLIGTAVGSGIILSLGRWRVE
jgi:glycerol uptake facilitator-like aquaporin